MVQLQPLRYKSTSGSTFFDADRAKIFVSYEVEQPKKMIVLKGYPTASIKVEIDQGREVADCSYEIPKNFSVGDELPPIENALYGLTEQTVRTFYNLRLTEGVERKVRGMEDDYIYPDLARIRRLTEGEGTEEDTLYQSLDKLTDDLITTLQYVTGITSLSRDGFEEYGKGGNVPAVVNAGLPERKVDLVTDVRDFMELNNLDSGKRKNAQDRVRNYLLQRRGDGEIITDAKIRGIVDNFVGPYIDIKREGSPRFPKDIGGHAWDSFIDGGIKGWISLSLIGEAVINNILHTTYDIPGWYIGAATAFVWPYAKGSWRTAKGVLTSGRRLNRLEEAVNRQLAAPKQLTKK